MQLLYNIVIAKPNFPFEHLTYSSSEELKIGTVVQVEIKSVILFGIVISQSNLKLEQIKNLKSITKLTPFTINNTQLEFLNKISFLTFNSLSNLLTLALKPYEHLVDSNIDFEESNIIKINIRIDQMLIRFECQS